MVDERKGRQNFLVEATPSSTSDRKFLGPGRREVEGTTQQVRGAGKGGESRGFLPNE
jgi:hypothetical protein